ASFSTITLWKSETLLQSFVAHGASETDLLCAGGAWQNDFDLLVDRTRCNVGGAYSAAFVVIAHERKLAKSISATSASGGFVSLIEPVALFASPQLGNLLALDAHFLFQCQSPNGIALPQILYILAVLAGYRPCCGNPNELLAQTLLLNRPAVWLGP